MRIGIDLGGTKTEVIALSEQGEQLFRHRLPTPRDDYHQTIETIARLVDMAEQATGQTGTVGMGIPGSISPYTGVVKNANSTWLNGQPFDKDLSQRLNREVRLANDANCLAVSEAIDGVPPQGPRPFLRSLSGPAVAQAWPWAGVPILAATVRRASGDITPCRGWMTMNLNTAPRCRAIAASRAVLRRLSPAPVLPPITIA